MSEWLAGRFWQRWPFSASARVPVTIISLFVARTYRGQGWGGQLVELFLARAYGVDAPHVAVTAYPANDAAIRFYRSHGFEPLEKVLRLTGRAP